MFAWIRFNICNQHEDLLRRCLRHFIKRHKVDKEKSVKEEIEQYESPYNHILTLESLLLQLYYAGGIKIIQLRRFFVFENMYV